MSYKKIFWGVILITIGILIMLKNLDLIWFSWHSLWALWPVMLILWGISVLPVKDYIKLIISLVTVAGGIAVVSTQPDINTFGFVWHRHNHEWNVDYKNSADFKSDENYSEPYDKNTKTATLDFDAAAGKFILEEPTDNLYNFDKSGGDVHYETSVEKDSTSALVKLRLRDSSISNGKGTEAHIKLNATPIWDVKLSVGAADMHMDLSKFKVRTVNFDGGASSIYLKLGEFNEDQKVKINAGASEIKLYIPKTRACEVRTNTVLSSRQLDGFNRIERHLYRTNNFNAAKTKTYIDVEAAVSNLKVETY